MQKHENVVHIDKERRDIFGSTGSYQLFFIINLLYVYNVYITRIDSIYKL